MGLNNPALLQIPQSPWVLAHSSGTRMTLHMYGDPATDMGDCYYTCGADMMPTL
jgi:hypothetical protein